jgi:Predicted transmembrane transcriptional regulator (anti-sigma factor)
MIPGRRLRSRIKALKFRYHPAHITCAEADAFLGDYVDGQLPPRQRILFERHIESCPACKRYLKRYRTMQRLLERQREAAASDAATAMPEDLVQAILKARIP